jgi:hypothetical protein
MFHVLVSLVSFVNFAPDSVELKSEDYKSRRPKRQ